MSRLFILTRTWGYKDKDGGIRTQALDGAYINKLAVEFPNATIGIVLADEREFNFVYQYQFALTEDANYVMLRQTIRGNFLRKLINQAHNMWRIFTHVIKATHVVVFMSSFSALWATLASAGFRRQILLYSGNDWAADTYIKLEGSPIFVKRIRTRLADFLETQVLRMSDVRLVNSSKLYKKCRSFPKQSERVRPISQFGRNDLFLRDDTCTSGKINLLYPAAIIPRKNHVALFRALGHLGSSLEFNLWLPGARAPGGLGLELESLAEELGIASKVHFVGYLAAKEDMRRLLQMADIFVLPSLNEGFPRVVWEAMLHSLPCAVSKIPNIVSEFGTREVALLFDPRNPIDIASTLARIATDADLRKNLISRSRAYAQEVFAESWEEQLDRILTQWH